MQNIVEQNINNILDIIKTWLTNTKLDYTISEEQKGMYEFNILNYSVEFNTDIIVDTRDEGEINVYFSKYELSGEFFDGSSWTTSKDLIDIDSEQKLSLFLLECIHDYSVVKSTCNITNVLEHINDTLYEFGLEFDTSEEQEGTHVFEIYSGFNHVFEIHSNFNIDAVIEVVVDKNITIHYYIRYNDETKYSSKWSLSNDFTAQENEDGIKEIILEFNDNLAYLNTVIDDIMLKIHDIINICNGNGLNYEDFIKDKIS